MSIVLYVIRDKDYVIFDKIRLSLESSGELVQGSQDPYYINGIFNEKLH